jgi:hypothetical protein
MMGQDGNVGWWRIRRNLEVIDPKMLRGRVTSVPEMLCDSTLLLVREGSDPVREYVYGDRERLSQAGDLGGFAVEECERDDGMPVLPDRAVRMAHPLVPYRARLTRHSAVEKINTDPMQVRRGLDTSMAVDSYVSVTVRKRGYFENRRIHNWLVDEFSSTEDTSSLVESGAMLVRVAVGAPTSEQARAMSVSVGKLLMPDMSDMQSHVSRPGAGLPLLCGVLLPFLLVASVLFGWVRPVVGLWVFLLPIACIVGLVYGLWRLRGCGRYDDIMQMPRHFWRWARRRRAQHSDQATQLGVVSTHERREYAYPLQRTTLVVNALTLISVYMPVGTGVASAQAMRPVPEPLTVPGIYLGKDPTGRDANIQVDQLYGGIAVTGEAGSGKSALQHGILQWAMSHRSDTDARYWGADSRTVSLIMKDDSETRIMREYALANGLPVPHVSYLADPDCPGIDFLGLRSVDARGRLLDARRVAETVAANMQYSFEEGDIKGNSLEMLSRVLTVGVACERYAMPDSGEWAGRSYRVRAQAGSRSIVGRVHMLEQAWPGAGKAEVPESVIGWALIACGARAGQMGAAHALGQVVQALYVENPDDVDLREAADAVTALYGLKNRNGQMSVGSRDFLAQVSSSMNKLAVLAQNEHVFSSRRGTITWSWVLDHPGDYEFVAAPHTVTDGEGREHTWKLGDRLDRVLGCWMAHSLWDAVRSHCQGWEDKGRHTLLACDELSMLVNLDGETVTGMHEQGRSFGLIELFSTQYPMQLPERTVRPSFMGYSTFVAFSNQDANVTSMIAARLGMSDGWTGDDISNLPKYTAAVRTRIEVQAQPAFTARIHDFDHHPIPIGGVTPTP